MKKQIVFLFFLLSLSSCSFIIGTQNLGGGYYFDTDEILYTEKSFYDGIGYNVIPRKVLSYNKTDQVIIASSLNNRGIIKYWLILKTIPKKKIKYIEDDTEFVAYYSYDNVIGPLSEDEFKEARKKYSVPDNLNLELVKK